MDLTGLSQGVGRAASWGGSENWPFSASPGASGLETKETATELRPVDLLVVNSHGLGTLEQGVCECDILVLCPNTGLYLLVFYLGFLYL